MNILFFDTETTGKAVFGSSASAAFQPRVVQLAALLCDADAKEVASLNLIIKPDNFTIPEEASAIHGITTKFAVACGVGGLFAMSVFRELVEASALIVAHNAQFDLLMLEIESNRRLISIPIRESFCTMLAMTDVCRITNPYGYANFKWPKLQEAYVHCFGKEFDGAHDALADVRACRDVYFWLKNGGGK